MSNFIKLNILGDTIVRIESASSPTISAKIVLPPTIQVGIKTGVRGPKGDKGDQGVPGSSAAPVVYQAGQNISSGRGVVIQSGLAYYFNASNPLHLGLIFGISATSASSGNDILIQLSGEITDASFNFVPERLLWFGEDGEIFDQVPTGAQVLQKAGISTTTNKMKIDFSTQVQLLN